jgi:hypothetical protein
VGTDNRGHAVSMAGMIAVACDLSSIYFLPAPWSLTSSTAKKWFPCADPSWLLELASRLMSAFPLIVTQWST